MKPINQTVIVKLLQFSKTKADIALAGEESDRDLIAGEILESSVTQWVKGQKVVFGKYSIMRFLFEGVEYNFLPVEDIIGIIE